MTFIPSTSQVKSGYVKLRWVKLGYVTLSYATVSKVKWSKAKSGAVKLRFKVTIREPLHVTLRVELSTTRLAYVLVSYVKLSCMNTFCLDYWFHHVQREPTGSSCFDYSLTANHMPPLLAHLLYPALTHQRVTYVCSKPQEINTISHLTENQKSQRKSLKAKLTF